MSELTQEGSEQQPSSTSSTVYSAKNSNHASADCRREREREEKKRGHEKKKKKVFGIWKSIPTMKYFRNVFRLVVLNRKFILNLEYALRQAVGVAIAAALATSGRPPLSTRSLLPINTVLSMSPNLGATLEATYEVFVGSCIGGSLGGFTVCLIDLIFSLPPRIPSTTTTGTTQIDLGDISGSEIGARTLAGVLFFFFSFVISFWFQNLLIMRRMALGTLALTTLTSVPSNFSPAFVWQFVLAIIIDSGIASGLSVGMLLLPWPRTAHSQLLLLLGENLGQSFEVLTLMLERCGVTTSSKTKQPGELEFLSPPHHQHHWMNKMSGGKKEENRRKDIDIEATDRSSSSSSTSSSSSPPLDLPQQVIFSFVSNPTCASKLGVLEGLRTHPEAKTLISDLRKRFSLIQKHLEDSRRELLVFPFIPVLFLQAYFVWKWKEGRIQPCSTASSLTPSTSPSPSPDCPVAMATLPPASSSLNIFNPPCHLFKSVEQLERVAKSLALLSEHLDGMVQVEVNTLTNDLHCSFLEQLRPNLLQLGSELYTLSNELFAAVTGRPAPNLLAETTRVQESLSVSLCSINTLISGFSRSHNPFQYIQNIMVTDNSKSESEHNMESPSVFLLNGHVSQLTSLGFFFFNFEKAVEELGRVSACLLQSKREAQAEDQPWIQQVLRMCVDPIISLFNKHPIHHWKRWETEKRLQNSLRASVTLLLASLIVLVSEFHLSLPPSSLTYLEKVPYFQERLPRGWWAAATVAYLVEPWSSGGTLNRAFLRTIGTVFGAVAGYLTLTFFNSNDYVVVLCLSIWTFFAGYVRSNERWSYAGAVAAFTAALIIYGFGNAWLEAQTFVLARIQSTLVGVGLVILIVIIWPERATELLKIRVYCSTQEIAQLSTGTVTSFLHYASSSSNLPPSPSTREALLITQPDIDQILKISVNVEGQRKLLSEALVEPQLWRHPLPQHSFEQIIRNQKMALHYILVAQVALSQICTLWSSCHLAKSEKEEGEYDVENQELEVPEGEERVVFRQNTVCHPFITSGEVEQVLLTSLQSLMELSSMLRKSPGKKQTGAKEKSQQQENGDLASSGSSSSSSLPPPSKFTHSTFVTTSRFQPATAWKTAKLLEYLEIEEKALVDTKLSVLALVYSIHHLSKEIKEIWTVLLELLILKFNQLQKLYG